jgi:hypothetical protein
MKNILVDRYLTYKLKRNLLVILFLMVIFLSEGRAAPAAQPLAIPPQGVFQRLIKIKYSSELYLIIKAKEANKLNKPELVDSALAKYNTIRWNLDGLVYQLSGDLVAANSPKKLRQLNTWCLNNEPNNENRLDITKITTEAQAIQQIEAFCSLYIPAFSSNHIEVENQQIDTHMGAVKNINLTTNVFYLLKDSYSFIKGLSDLKTQKTQALVEILDQIRLASPQELLKQIK